MKEFSGKTLEEALETASNETGTPVGGLVYRVTEEKKSLFSKKVTIEVSDINDATEYAEDYLRKAVGGMGVDLEFAETIEDDVIRITLNSPRNPILIGKNGRTLQALNELTKLAVSNRFHHRYRVLLDVNGYKEDKYSRIAYMARKTAQEVLRTRLDAKLEPMTPDERRVVHNTLSNAANIKTESVGEGKDRAVVIKYVD